MEREQAKEHIKQGLEGYLTSKGIDTRKPFLCLNPDHDDRNPSMSYDKRRNKAHCFSCGADYDTFDLIGIEHGLTETRDIFSKAHELFNIEIDGASAYQKNSKSEQYTHNTDNTQNTDCTAYFKECNGHISETRYPYDRGLTQETLERYLIGYDKAYSKGTGGAVWEALIIPTGKGSYTARNTNLKAEKENRIRKQGGSPIFNLKIAMQTEKPIFVVEGEIDALSVIEVGGNAIALGSTANHAHLPKYIKTLEKKPEQMFLIALDNDDKGEEAANKLLEALTAISIKAYKVNIAEHHKDANEALIADRGTFESAVRSAENIEEEIKAAEREAYLGTSAGSHLQEFIDGIAESVNTPYIPTGFNSLDSLLEGGLYEGLYILGAISSLGKTTLVTQIADQIAAAGNDVLIFSLEMARSEIMAKSISRHTLLNCLDGSGDMRLPKTTRGITTGKRYERYSAEEKSLITQAIDAYSQYAGNIYISEGIGDIGAGEIREYVQRHISITGKTPVVMIDYIQILAPYNERFTDKQNTDKAVLELKRISRDFKLPVIGISSFNRASYKEAVTMEAFKESGAIEYSSDVLIGLQLAGAGKKDFNANEEKKQNPRRIELKILKSRNGATGDAITYEYYPLFNYFKEC